MTHRELVIIRGKLQDIAAKGVMRERYYNPGNLFDEVHFLLQEDDCPNLEAVQRAVGNASFHLHNIPRPSFLRTLGWQPALIQWWIDQGVQLAREIRPDVVKVHNNFIHGYMAYKIKEATGIPYICSLHGVWDKDDLKTWQERLRRHFRKRYERITLENADAVFCVYASILRYAREYGAKNPLLIYNAVSNVDIVKKTDYTLHNPPRLITINRQVREKNPENIIRAAADLDCYYLLVGKGYLQEGLKQLAKDLGCDDRVEFQPSIGNEELMGMLKDFDLMVSHVDYWGMSRTVIEASLTGLPTILNKHPVEPIPEYEGDWLQLVDNTPEAYRAAIQRFMNDEDLRRAMGQRAYQHAHNTFDPEVMESQIVKVFKDVLGWS